MSETPTGPGPLPPVPQGAPVVLTAVPAFGLTAGGSPVLLVGANLKDVTTVTFGDTAGTVVHSDPLGLLLVVTAPAHAAGSAPVVVTTAAGASHPVPFFYLGVGQSPVPAPVPTPVPPTVPAPVPTPPVSSPPTP